MCAWRGSLQCIMEMWKCLTCGDLMRLKGFVSWFRLRELSRSTGWCRKLVRGVCGYHLIRIFTPVFTRWCFTALKETSYDRLLFQSISFWCRNWRLNGHIAIPGRISQALQTSTVFDALVGHIQNALDTPSLQSAALQLLRRVLLRNRVLTAAVYQCIDARSWEQFHGGLMVVSQGLMGLMGLCSLWWIKGSLMRLIMVNDWMMLMILLNDA